MLLQESGDYEGAGLPSFKQAMAAGNAGYQQNQPLHHQPHQYQQVGMKLLCSGDLVELLTLSAKQIAVNSAIVLFTLVRK